MREPATIEQLLTRGAWLAHQEGREDYAPRIRRTPSQWAAQVRRIASGTGVTRHETGYNHAMMPHLVEIMDAVCDPKVREIVMWFAKREGKTLGVCMNVIGWRIMDDPCNMMSVHPTENDADRFAIGDVDTTFDLCLAGYVVEKKSRDAGNTKDFKKFKGGWLRIIPSGSVTRFRGTTVPLVMIHEIDKVDAESVALAEGRTTGVADAKIIKESTGTLESHFNAEGREEYRSNIKQAYDRGTKEKWFCACKKCGFLQTLRYAQIQHPPGRLDLARYHCEACDYAHTPAEWRRMAAGGRWYPTARLTDVEIKDIERTHRHAQPLDPSVRSFWRNGFSSLLPHHSSCKSKLHEFVKEGEAAKASVKTLKIWKQETAAELWSESLDGEAPPPWRAIYERREDYNLIIPMGGLLVFAFADVQQNRVEVFWGAFGKREEFWALDHTVIDGSYLAQLTWDKLRAELKREWKHESGATLSLEMAHVDCGKWGDEIALNFFRVIREKDSALYGRVRASKGVGRNGHPVIITGTRTGMMAICGKLKGSHIGTWAAKDLIYARLKMEAPEKGEPSSPFPEFPDGWMHFNQRFDERVCEQFCSERVEITYPLGEEVRKYKNPDLSRNEGLDGLVGLLAGVRMRPRNWDAIEAQVMERAALANGGKAGERAEEPFFADLGGMRM